LQRLQETYELDVAELAGGIIAGRATGAQLSAKDVFYVGRAAFAGGSHKSAQHWLEAAALQVAAAASQNNTSATDVGVKQSQIEQVMKQIKRRLKRAPAAEVVTEKKKAYVLGNVPRKSHDFKK